MDNKESYESFEFLPASNNDADTNQFVVVQDDGTFLLNSQIQYVAQEQDGKEVGEDVQPCTMYGVSSQQFFQLDVDNPGDLISVSDPFILPEGENSLYTNSFLLQPSSSNTTEQMEEDVVVDQFKQPNAQDVDSDVVSHNSKQGNDLTEITLSDEQYHTLEQKGWILLELNDKILLLNTMGLHDITRNNKLIQKLRNELQNNDGNTKPEVMASYFPNMVRGTEPLSDQQETVNFVMGNDERAETIESVKFLLENKENTQESFPNVGVWNSTEPEVAMETKECKLTIDGAEDIQLNETNSIKIKTKFNFKDIPNKIILGKSVNGKRLVANVTRKVNSKNEDLLAGKDASDPQNNSNGLSDAEFISLVLERLQWPNTKLRQEDISSAYMVIQQLLKVPNIKEALSGKNLVVTKATNSKDEYGVIYNYSKPSLVTGRLTGKNDSTAFKHLPNLLQSIKTKADKQNTARSKETYICIEHNEIIILYNVHITETKCADNIVRFSVNLKERLVPDKIFLETSKVKAKSTPTPDSNKINEYFTYKDLDNPQNSSSSGLNETEFISLIQQRLQVGINTKVNYEDIASTEIVISQLMKVPNLRIALVGHNLIVTKTSHVKDEFGVIHNKSKESVVTGKVTETNNVVGFEHLPNLIQTIKARAERQNKRINETYSCIEEKDAKDNITLFHVHITETRCTDNIVRVSVTLKKRQLPINLLFSLKKRYPSPVFACSGCAALFKSEDTLREHQESECMDTDDMLTIETDNNKSEDVVILKKGKDKIYSCSQCDTTFTKLSNMQRHLKTHRISNSKGEAIIDENMIEQPNKLFKCKMCPSTYCHSASLSKHIVNKHIKIKSN